MDLRNPSRRGPWRALPSVVAALMVLSLASAPHPLQAQVRLPSLGEAGGEEVPLGGERRLGDQIMRELRRDPAFLEDPQLDDHVGGLWARLLEAARQRGELGPDLERAFAWELFLVRDRSLNAFALPGGYVGIHLGLIAATATADELASVMAHELSHVTQRHIARGIGRSQRDSAVGVAAMLLGVLLASRANNPDMAQAAIAGGQAAMIQGQLNFSRDMEREADRIGWGVFEAAGFAPSGMASMFDLLERASRLNDGGSFPYLRTHPLTVERLAEARSRLPPPQASHAGVAGVAAGAADAAGKAATADAVGRAVPAQPGTAAKVAAPVTAHDLMRARAAVLMNPTAPAWQDLVLRAGIPQGAAAGGAADLSAGYAGALAAMKLGDPATAHRLATALWEGVAGDGNASSPPPSATAALLVAMLRAELAMATPTADRQAQAMAWLDRADALAPKSPPRPGAGEASWTRARMMMRAEVAAGAMAGTIMGTNTGTKAGTMTAPPASPELTTATAPSAPQAARQVLDRLRTWVSDHPADALAWEWIGRLEQAQGRALRAQRALAEAQVLRGDLDGAIDRLRAAQAASRAPGAAQDFIEASIIDARLRLWMAQRRELAGTSRGPDSGSR